MGRPLPNSITHAALLAVLNLALELFFCAVKCLGACAGDTSAYRIVALITNLQLWRTHAHKQAPTFGPHTSSSTPLKPSAHQSLSLAFNKDQRWRRGNTLTSPCVEKGMSPSDSQLKNSSPACLSAAAYKAPDSADTWGSWQIFLDKAFVDGPFLYGGNHSGSHGRRKKVPPGAGEGSTDDVSLQTCPLPDTW